MRISPPPIQSFGASLEAKGDRRVRFSPPKIVENRRFSCHEKIAGNPMGLRASKVAFKDCLNCRYGECLVGGHTPPCHRCGEPQEIAVAVWFVMQPEITIKAQRRKHATNCGSKKRRHN